MSLWLGVRTIQFTRPRLIASSLPRSVILGLMLAKPLVAPQPKSPKPAKYPVLLIPSLFITMEVQVRTRTLPVGFAVTLWGRGMRVLGSKGTRDWGPIFQALFQRITGPL